MYYQISTDVSIRKHSPDSLGFINVRVISIAFIIVFTVISIFYALCLFLSPLSLLLFQQKFVLLKTPEDVFQDKKLLRTKFDIITKTGKTFVISLDFASSCSASF